MSLDNSQKKGLKKSDEANLKIFLRKCFKEIQDDIQATLKDIKIEIQEIKGLARKNRLTLDSMVDTPIVEEIDLEGIGNGPSPGASARGC